MACVDARGARALPVLVEVEVPGCGVFDWVWAFLLGIWEGVALGEGCTDEKKQENVEIEDCEEEHGGF